MDLVFNNKIGNMANNSNRLVLEYGITGNIEWLSFKLFNLPYSDENGTHNTWWNLGQSFLGLGPILSIGYEKDFFTVLFYIAGVFGMESFNNSGSPDLVNGRNMNLIFGFKYRFCFQLM
jgi:hypothetical protein